MRDILVTSSVLILALLILRQIFRKAISRRMQYALWGLVLLRLLVPVNLPALEHNVLTAAEPLGTSVTEQIDNVSVYLEPVGQSERAQSYVEPPDTFTPAVAVRDSRSDMVYEHDYHELNAVAWIMSEDGAMTWYAKALPLTDVLTCIWYAGIAVTACWLVFSNLRFWCRLRKGRIPYAIKGCKYSVYLYDGLPSPCLFGLFRPAIYLTPAAVSSPESLRHVLAHETTHARHLDSLWSVLRGVCLAVYWFDPLVWIAAIVSKTDCELACDEGALKCLGQDERVAYGRTLLALIPVVKTPADPMLAATTMTSGKRRLKDRITRIAENRQTVAAALFAVVAAAALLCAVTFTGAKSPAAQADSSLTSAELTYFNEEFFNGDGFNIRNQFLSSTYANAEELKNIDLFELFYNGTGLPESLDSAERRAVVDTGYGGEDPQLGLTKNSTANLDAVLMQYTGLTLAETNGVGLENFTYLPDHGAYYFFHGDTNYRGHVTIMTGERKDGLICLYYYDGFMDGCWKCVSLREVEDGYHFVSNQPCNAPAIPTAYPERAPELTIPLKNLSPYAAPELELGRYAAARTEQLSGGCQIGDYVVFPCRTYERTLRIAVSQPGDESFRCFLSFYGDKTEDDISLKPFYGLFGHDGISVSYDGLIREERSEKPSETQSSHTSIVTLMRIHGPVNDYFYFTDDGDPILLARVYGDVSAIDLDGDGAFELTAFGDGIAQVFFQRDGDLYCADIKELVENAWPDAQYLSFGRWDAYGRSLRLSGEVPISGAETRGTAFRDMYFDGESLLLYKDRQTAADHVMEGIEAPEDVLVSAKMYVRKLYNERWTSSVRTEADYDDWRIAGLSGPYYADIGGMQIEAWQLNYEWHTSTPQLVSPAGARYITEDGWTTPARPNDCYLYFQLDGNGSRAHLYTAEAVDSFFAPDTELFRADIARRLTSMGLLSLGDLDGQDLLDLFYSQSAAFLNSLASDQPEAVQAAVIEILSAYIASNDSDDVQKVYEYCIRHIAESGSELTEAGLALWTALQAEVTAPVPTDAEAALSRFTANPTSFLNRAAQLPETSRRELCQGLAHYYGGGSSAQQARFRDAMHSVTQEQLSSGATEVYELLRTSCALPGPAERTAADEREILEKVQIQMDNRRQQPGCLYLNVLELAIDEEETARNVQRYTASLLANGRGWTDDYTSRMVAVRVVYDIYYDFSKLEPWIDEQNGTNAWYTYLMPDPIAGTWEILGGMYAYTPQALGALSLESAVHSAILANANTDEYFSALPFKTEAHQVLAVEERATNCTVYAKVFFRGYSQGEKGPVVETGGNIPAAITFDTSTGTFQLLEFWTTPGGVNYVSGIRAKFPADAAEEMLEPTAYGQSLSDQCDAAAETWFDSLAA